MQFLGLLANFGLDNGYYAFIVSDGFGKFIVWSLLGLSIFSWSAMLNKGLELIRIRKLSVKYLNNFKRSKSISDFSFYKMAYKDPCPLARVYCSGVEKLISFYDNTPNARKSGQYQPKKITTAQKEAIRTVLENSVSEQIMFLESSIPLLSLAVSVSPFGGLLGTVWGVMQAFCGAAKAGKADIAALAPGIAGALLTTVVGLVVAIPSLVGYNLLTNSIRKNTVQMDNFVEEFMTRLGLEQLEFESEPTPIQAQGFDTNEAFQSAQVVMPLNTLLQSNPNMSAAQFQQAQAQAVNNPLASNPTPPPPPQPAPTPTQISVPANQNFSVNVDNPINNDID